MVGYLLMILYTFLNLGESIAVKEYSKKYGSGGMLMNGVIALFATLFFVITDTDGFNAPLEMIPFALINAVLFAAGYYYAFVAYATGSYGLTRLITSFGLLFSIFYGIFFLEEPTTVFTYIGIALILAALVLINYHKRKEGEPSSIRPRWVFAIIAVLISNGFIGILTRHQQILFNDSCSKEFQIISIGLSALILLVLGLTKFKADNKTVMTRGVIYGGVAGIMNGAKNFVTLAIYLHLPLSIISPTKTGLGLLLSFAMAIIVYKEKYTLRQIIGVVLGAAAVIILAIS